MHELQQTSGTAIVLITHDLGVVAEVADAVAVMYGGRIVEQAPVRTLFEQPQHPYTVGLLGSMPRLHGRAGRLAAIPGQVPGPLARPPGCAFADRCPFAEPACRAQVPALRELQQQTGTAVVLITHDLGVVAEVADEVAVMYCGRIVEQAPVATLFAEPQHPYTIGLLGSMPRLHGEPARLAAIGGQVPGPSERPAGCAFADRCPFAQPHCRAEAPALRVVGADHRAACWRAPLDADLLLAQPSDAVAA